jgi:glyoxylate/hydroxypyruvate reductase
MRASFARTVTSLRGCLRPALSRSTLRRMSNNHMDLPSPAAGKRSFRVLVTRKLPDVALQLLRAVQGIELDVYERTAEAIPADELKQRAKGVDGMLVLLTDKVTADLVHSAGSNLKIVSTMSVGYNHVDTRALAERGIVLGYTPDCLTETTADTTVALLLVTARRIGEAMAAVRDGSWGTWDPLWMCGTDVHGSTVGIIGCGRIGQAVARRLKAFGCRILYSGPRPKPEADEIGCEYVSEEVLLRESDFVVPMFPLNDATKGFFNMERFRMMKPTAMLINATRGEAVNQDDLCAALQQRVIAGAGLDVTTPEPLPTNSQLLSLNNCVIFPHIGSATVATREKMATMAADNIAAFATGRKVPYQAKL